MQSMCVGTQAVQKHWLHCKKLFFTQYINIILYIDIKLLKQVAKHLNYFSYIITNIKNVNLPLTESQLYCLFFGI